MRIVTRGDMDGLACAVLISACEQVHALVLIHPQDITDKKFEVTNEDILANLPYHPRCRKWFDHHLLTRSNERPPEHFEGRYGLAPSAARVVYEYYLPACPDIKRFGGLLSETDRLDSAHLNIDDVLEPKDYILLGYTLDPRTGLGAYKEYFELLLQALKTKSIDEIMVLPAVAERVARLKEQDDTFRKTTLAHSRLEGNVVFTDFRELSHLPVGNRFIVYTLFPQANVSLRVHWGPGRETVAATVGHSIFTRTCRTNVGALMSDFGGGGHRGAGTCLLPAAQAEEKIQEIIGRLRKNG